MPRNQSRRGWHRSLLKIRKPIHTLSCQTSTKCGKRARPPRPTPRRLTVSWKRARLATFPGQYLANTVLFATVLFFASASGKFEQRRARVVAFAFAVAVFLFSVVQTAMLPR